MEITTKVNCKEEWLMEKEPTSKEILHIKGFLKIICSTVREINPAKFIVFREHSKMDKNIRAHSF